MIATEVLGAADEELAFQISRSWDAQGTQAQSLEVLSVLSSLPYVVLDEIG